MTINSDSGTNVQSGRIFASPPAPSPNEASVNIRDILFVEGEFYVRGASAPLRKLLPCYEQEKLAKNTVGVSRCKVWIILYF
jgi:hypothetical protein